MNTSFVGETRHERLNGPETVAADITQLLLAPGGGRADALEQLVRSCTRTRSVSPQRRHRIDTCGTSRRQQCCQHGDDAQQRHDACDGGRIAR
jgi:hypothetical protein